MSLSTNMDHNTTKDPNLINLRFTLPVDEVREHVEVGQLGTVTIPCKVIEVKDGMITFDKAGKVRSDGGFHSATASEMREDLNIADRQ